MFRSPGTSDALGPAKPIAFEQLEAAVGGAPPQWPLNLYTIDTPEGIELSIHDWCRSNIVVIAVQLTIENVTLSASIWRPRSNVRPR